LATKKKSFIDENNIKLEVGCSAIIQKDLPVKSKYLGSFTILVTIDALYVDKALLDLGASLNLMPLVMLKKISDLEIKPTKMTLQLTNRVSKYSYGVVKNVLIKVDTFIYPVDFL